ncbi:hypothetical protein QWY31_01890 [Cytophagales bacterium LB-30]|uniref:Uncharacterized protein n=1 Tax=Shiella aurantiaca TaxID=3058365 RepID=A0ABT8F1B2_9BACT|nr:hypothetical protein [Shiella aurantiaca]MDN4164230.1 hypothetical protein [Shiella aurantiaca]
MKLTRILFGALLLFFTQVAYSQNKTLGVGTTTPNPNAALHVESPTSNQGMIMPRLTSAQRESMATILTADDNGLMLYDTDLKELYIWDGTLWKAGGSFKLPFNDTLTNEDLMNSFNALNLTYTGDSARTLLNIDFNAPNNPNITNPFRLTHRGQGAAMLIDQRSTFGTGVIITSSDSSNTLSSFRANNQGLGIAGHFITGRSTNTNPTVRIQNSGSGAGLDIQANGAGNAISTNGVIQAGSFVGDGSQLTGISGGFSLPYADTLQTVADLGAALSLVGSSTNRYNTLYAEASSDSLGAAILGNNVGEGFGVVGRSSASRFGSSAIYGEHTGTGDAAGAFRISNTTNAYAALYGETNGTGTAITAQQFGTGHGAFIGVGQDTTSGNGSAGIFVNHNGMGRAGQFQNMKSTNPNAAVRGFTAGTGNAAFFTINNANNISSGVYSTTNGSGAAIEGRNLGASDGFAGVFANTIATNNFPAIQAETQGTGPGLRVIQSPTSLGGGLDMYLQNPASNAAGVAIDQAGNAPSLFIYHRSVTPAIELTQIASGHSALFTSLDSLNSLPNLQINTHSNAGASGVNSEHYGGGDAVRGVKMAGSIDGSGGNFQIFEPSNTQASVYSATQGTGRGILAENHNPSAGGAALFRNSNSGNTDLALSVEHLGGGTAAGIFQNGTGNGLYVDLANTPNYKRGLEVFHNGEAGEAAYFGNQNTNNPNPSVYINNNSTIGNAQALFVQSTGNASAALLSSSEGPSGSAAILDVIDSTNTSNALQITNNGLGSAIYINNNTASSSMSALEINSNSTGGAFRAMNNATTGPAALLENLNGENTEAVLSINHFGAGNAITANAPISASEFIGDGSQLTNVGLTLPYSQIDTNGSTLFDLSNGGTGATARFENNGGGIALQAELNGTGTAFSASATAGVAGSFSSAAANPANTVEISNNGDGIALAINHTSSGSLSNAVEINNSGGRRALSIFSSSSFPALDVSSSTTGPGGFFYLIGSNPSYALQGRNDGLGKAGEFLINNASNSSTALDVSTNGTGAAVTINQTNGGIGLDLQSGGVRVSTLVVPSPTTITTRAIAYELTTAGAYTLDASLIQEGVKYFIYNADGITPASVNGINIPASSGRVFIVIGGNLRGF